MLYSVYIEGSQPRSGFDTSLRPLYFSPLSSPSPDICFLFFKANKIQLIHFTCILQLTTMSLRHEPFRPANPQWSMIKIHGTIKCLWCLFFFPTLFSPSHSIVQKCFGNCFAAATDLCNDRSFISPPFWYIKQNGSLKFSRFFRLLLYLVRWWLTTFLFVYHNFDFSLFSLNTIA